MRDCERRSHVMPKKCTTSHAHVLALGSLRAFEYYLVSCFCMDKVYVVYYYNSSTLTIASYYNITIVCLDFA